MSAQTQQIFHDCTSVAKELEQQGRQSEALSVLRAVHVYLDYMSVFDDGSLARTVGEEIDRLSAVAQEPRT